MILRVFVLLVFASPVSAQVTVDFTYQAMPVSKVRIGLRQTSVAQVVGTVTVDGVSYPMTGTIPQTWVRGAGRVKMTDACLMSGTFEGGTITQAIPCEPVVGLYAQPVWTTVTVTVGGYTHSGQVLLPRAKFRLIGSFVEPVQVKGMLP